MNLRGVSIVFKKEIKDLFRDRKTLIMGILIPLIIFPVMYGLMGKSMDSTTRKVSENMKISIQDNGNSTFTNFIKSQKNITIVQSKDIKKDVQEGNIYAGIIIPSNFDMDIRNEKQSNIKIIYDDTSQSSEMAYSSISALIDGYSKEVVKSRLQIRKINPEILVPITTTDEVAAKEKGGTGRAILSMILPLFLIIYSITSPLGAATDLGAGEKERGTLEPLLTTHASRMNLLFGKLFAITVIGVIGVVASLTGLVISFRVAGDMFQGASLTLSPIAIVFVGIFSIMLTMIFGAIELAISIYARSFKEAQTYLSPLTIIGMLGAFGTFTMDIKNVSAVLFNIPIANMALVIKEFISGIYNPLHIGLTFLWMIIYIGFSIGLARYMFSREEVIFRT